MKFLWHLHGKTLSGQYTDEVDGVALAVTLKPIRHVYLRMTSADGPVRVSAPVGTTPEAIRSFVETRLHWIQAQRKRLGRRVDPVPDGFVRYLGSLVAEQELCGDTPPQGRKAVLQARLRRELHERLAAYLDIWQPRMNLYATSWHVRRMTSRWGSCNTVTGRLCFNAELIRHAPVCIEYVVVHELAHLAVRGHNSEFWGLVAATLPDWKQRRDLLKKN